MNNICRLVATFLAAFPVCVYGQSKGAIKEAIEAKYTLAQTNDDRTDLTAAGSVIVLLKDDLALETTAEWNDLQGNPHRSVESVNTYKGGKFTRAGLMKFLTAGPHERILVSGQKCWLIGDEVKDDGVYLEIMSDPIQGARFKGYIKFPFPKGQILTADTVMSQIAETIKTDGPPPAAAQAGPAPAAAPPAPPAPAMAAIPPPPPPADQPPPTLEKGMTKDQVVAGFGQPARVVKLGTKEIDYYKDMKVTYLAGKVSNVE